MDFLCTVNWVLTKKSGVQGNDVKLTRQFYFGVAAGFHCCEINPRGEVILLWYLTPALSALKQKSITLKRLDRIVVARKEQLVYLRYPARGFNGPRGVSLTRAWFAKRLSWVSRPLSVQLMCAWVLQLAYYMVNMSVGRIPLWGGRRGTAKRGLYH